MNIVEICAAEDSSVSASYKGGISGHLLSMELICYLAPTSPQGSVSKSNFLIQRRSYKYLFGRDDSLIQLDFTIPHKYSDRNAIK